MIQPKLSAVDSILIAILQPTAQSSQVIAAVAVFDAFLLVTFTRFFFFLEKDAVTPTIS